MTNFFTERKFLSLSHIQKHKHAMRLVQKCYKALLSRSPSFERDVHEYLSICNYLGTLPENIDLETLSSLFHYHLKEARLCRNEQDFLPKISSHDTPSSEPFLPIDIFLDELRSAHNVGSILRTTEAFRLGQVYFSPSTPWIDQKKVQDVSMGTFSKVSCHKWVDFKYLKKPLIALETSNEAISVYDFIFPPSFTLALGNEERGLSTATLQQADIILTIPLYGEKNSVNVASSLAITAFEIRRQLSYKK